ncbi:MAG: LPS export ABC transporter periplasmic protein LptC [Nitrosomonas sp.]|nr:LPS export ABC transporter periplasmic protein LptC [Nitrosomonas sp.]MDP1950112.1 LPS export ABC transporter periplasmic protein LptC [Nitrosomonas sp.]
MISRLHRSIPLILLILLASLTFWMTSAVVPPMIMQEDNLDRKPDYIIENLSGVRMDHDRAVQRTFSAKKMLHYLESDITHLEQPYFTNTEPKGPIMRVKAEKAEFTRNGEDIYLTGNVTILRGADKDKVTMLTSFLHLIPDENIAKTDQTVVIARKNTTVNAVGLELDNRTGVIQLLSQVRAIDN